MKKNVLFLGLLMMSTAAVVENMNAAATPTWTCQSCTLDNPIHVAVCDACGNSRPEFGPDSGAAVQEMPQPSAPGAFDEYDRQTAKIKQQLVEVNRRLEAARTHGNISDLDANHAELRRLIREQGEVSMNLVHLATTEAKAAETAGPGQEMPQPSAPPLPADVAPVSSWRCPACALDNPLDCAACAACQCPRLADLEEDRPAAPAPEPSAPPCEEVYNTFCPNIDCPGKYFVVQGYMILDPEIRTCPYCDHATLEDRNYI